jgi:tetratricopeptide (TPR) repeat protein
MKSTANGSGTPSYRAPELLKEFPSYNQKVDIFALGCILFELATKGKKVFANDYAVIEYRGSGTDVIIPLTPDIETYWRNRLSSLIFQMFAVDASHRPSVDSLRNKFEHERSLAVGEAYIKGGQFSLAISVFNEAIENNIADGQTWRNLGNAYHADGKYSAAITSLQKAISLNIKDPAPRFDLGNAYLSSSKYKLAIETFQTARKSAPRDPNLLERLGDAYY